jgi:hypothetical protein
MLIKLSYAKPYQICTELISVISASESVVRRLGVSDPTAADISSPL